jgi:hypothetical protein
MDLSLLSLPVGASAAFELLSRQDAKVRQEKQFLALLGVLAAQPFRVDGGTPALYITYKL